LAYQLYLKLYILQNNIL